MPDTQNKNLHDTNNKSPHLILDHTWEIDLSLKPNRRPPAASQSEYFQPGDRFKILRTVSRSQPLQKQEKLLFVIHPNNDRFIYDLNAKLLDWTESQLPDGSPMLEYAKVIFNDTIGGKQRDRIIELHAVKFKEKGYNPSVSECTNRLVQVSDFIDSGDHKYYCADTVENLLIWKIHDFDDGGSGSNSPNATYNPAFGPPEPGQGTASGGSR